MKKGWILALTGVSLFAGTVIWSAFKTVPRPPRFVPDSKTTFENPVRKEVNRFVFDADAPFRVNVEAPIQVELVPDFKGVELIGDTSFIRHLGVQTSSINGSTSIDIHVLSGDGNKENAALHQPDSPEYAQFLAAHIRARIGLGTDENRLWRQRHFSFSNCYKVISASPLSATNLSLSFFQTDSMWLNVQTENLAVDFPSIAFKNPNWLKLSGHCDRIALNKFTAGTLDATALEVRDFYAYMPKEAALHIRATRLARMTEVENCQVKVEGNPKYQWIEDRSER